MQVKLLFFASLTNKIGQAECTCDVPAGSTIEDIKRNACEEFPELIEILPICHVSVNHEYARGNLVLKEHDEVAFFPPVSGG